MTKSTKNRIGLTLRIDIELHAALVADAKRHRVSLNREISNRLFDACRYDDVCERLDRIENSIRTGEKL